MAAEDMLEEFLTKRVDFTNVTWCLPCRMNEHVDCEWHINDGAFDALDFIAVHCNCPCAGKVDMSYKRVPIVEYGYIPEWEYEDYYDSLGDWVNEEMERVYED